MGNFKDEHPEYSDGLMVFALQFATASRWSINALLGDYNECDMECTRGSPEPCGCRCILNPDDLTNDEVCVWKAKIGDFLRSTYGVVSFLRVNATMFCHDRQWYHIQVIIASCPRLGATSRVGILHSERCKCHHVVNWGEAYPANGRAFLLFMVAKVLQNSTQQVGSIVLRGTSVLSPSFPVREAFMAR